MNTNPLIEVSGLSKSFVSKAKLKSDVLIDLSMTVDRGEFVALVGPSGVGKSTLLHILGSLDTADSGTIIFNPNNEKLDYSKINKEKFASIRNKLIGFVFQFSHLLPEFSSLENVMMPALIAGDSYSQAKQKAELLIRKVGMEHRISNKPMELSGGEQQRISIARALINSPQIVLADEPTGNLDEKNAIQIFELLKKLQSEYQLTLVIATHSNDIANGADRVMTMGGGKILSNILNKNTKDR